MKPRRAKRSKTISNDVAQGTATNATEQMRMAIAITKSLSEGRRSYKAPPENIDFIKFLRMMKTKTNMDPATYARLTWE